MAWNDGIVGNALQIAQTDNSPLRVMAGPGTGKSFAMRRRVARLLEVEKVDPDRILAVTFTRTAAKDLKNELDDLDIEGSENIDAGTLHSFCFRLLSKNRVLEYLSRHPQPLLTIAQSGVLKFQAEPMLYDLQRKGDFGGLRDMTTRIRAYEAAWARLQVDDPGRAQNQVDANFERELISWLSFHQGMLVGELVPYALRYLRENPASPELEMYDYVIVDEYQDLNRAEQELVDCISTNSSISIVGDVDQSIYSFKHAHPEGIIEYSDTHDDTHDEILNECRRCPKSVVSIADSLIKENHDTDDVRLTAHQNNPDGQVDIAQFNSFDDESNGLSELINHLVNNDDYDPGDILMLTPRRAIAYQVRDNLNDLNIPVHSYYQEEALEDQQAQLAFNKLSLLVDRENRIALRYWLGYGSNTWHRNPYRYVIDHCNQHGLSPINVLEGLENGDIKLPYSAPLIDRYREINQELMDLEAMNVEEVLNILFPESEEWAEQLRELALGVFHQEITLRNFLGELTTKLTQPVMPEDGEYVRIMSLHKSKGLSSPVVIVAGCVEGLIPMINTDLPGPEQRRMLEEQRRLFYVAITRTRQRLILSSFRNIDRALAFRIGALVQGSRTITSRFIRELGNSAPNVMNGHNWAENDYQ